jgi:hypothetical protein
MTCDAQLRRSVIRHRLFIVTCTCGWTSMPLSQDVAEQQRRRHLDGPARSTSPITSSSAPRPAPSVNAIDPAKRCCACCRAWEPQQCPTPDRHAEPCSFVGHEVAG